MRPGDGWEIVGGGASGHVGIACCIQCDSLAEVRSISAKISRVGDSAARIQLGNKGVGARTRPSTTPPLHSGLP